MVGPHEWRGALHPITLSGQTGIGNAQVHQPQIRHWVGRVVLKTHRHPLFVSTEYATNLIFDLDHATAKTVGTPTNVYCATQTGTAKSIAQTNKPTPQIVDLTPSRGDREQAVKQEGKKGYQHTGNINKPSFEKVRSLAQVPINLKNLKKMLKNYPNKKAAEFLDRGFSEGFDLNYTGPRMPVDLPNLKSVENNMEIAREKILKELKLGRYMGPFASRPLDNLRSSPIGLVPKKSPGEYRLINHLSFPPGYSVNDFIADECCKVEYTSFDKAADMIAQTGRGAELAKEDIKSAFRLLPISPKDFELLGVKFEGQYYIDKCLPMGVRNAPAYFEQFSTFIEHCVKVQSGSDRVIHYMDDFLCIGPAKSMGVSCHRVVQALKSVCEELGIPLAQEKSEGPTTRLTFLSLELDSSLMQVRVPHDKLAKARSKISKVLSLKTTAVKEIQSLVGLLNFICRAVRPGRAFLRRLIDLTQGQTVGKRQLTLSEGARLDLQSWLLFLECFNGISVIPEECWLNNEEIDLFTDSSGGIGFGGYLNGKWFNGKWSSRDVVSNNSIAWKEMVPITMAVLVWGEELRNRRIVLNTDNMSIKFVINKQTSHDPKIMKLVRTFVVACLKNNISFRAVHVRSHDNSIADSLSRFQMDRFHKLATGADKRATPIPMGLLPI